MKKLQEVLRQFGVPHSERVSSKWRCEVLKPQPQSAEDEEGIDEERLLECIHSNTPCFLPHDAAAAAVDSHMVSHGHDKDGVGFVTDAKWDKLPKPQIAYRPEWAAPGTLLEDAANYTLVNSFSEMLLSPSPSEKLNLQLFHRRGSDGDTAAGALPDLGSLLQWPIVLEDGATCETATRVSQNGAITWWHIDDCGEITMEYALPLLLSSGNVPVKLFIFAPSSSYDWFIFDHLGVVEGEVKGSKEEEEEQGEAEVASSQRNVRLDLFSTADAALPEQELLPTLRVAALYPGGQPLLLPPNTPHFVITLRSCAVVEQRRVANLALDEVAYFAERAKLWHTPPITYSYVAEQLQDERFVHNELVPSLVATFHAATEASSYFLKARIAASLYAIALFDETFALEGAARKSLRETLSAGEFAEFFGAPEKEKLLKYWDVKRLWPSANVRKVVENGNFSSSVPGFVAVVPGRGWSPVFGPVRGELSAAKQDAQRLRSCIVAGNEEQFFAQGGEWHDEVLDELF